jgi:hypothetical protein
LHGNSADDDRPATNTANKAPSTNAVGLEFLSGEAPHLKRMEYRAIHEIQAHLNSPDNEGLVWIDGWDEKYLPSLGALRTFLEKHPDRFTVIPMRWNRFRVVAAN